MAKRKQPSEEYFVRIEQTVIPVQVFYEYRNNARVASGKDSVYLRIPRFCTRSERSMFKGWCNDWIHEQWGKNARFRASFAQIDILKVERFATFNATYQVHVTQTERSSATSRIEGNNIHMTIPISWNAKESSDMAYIQMHRVLSKHYKQSVTDRLNALHGGRFSKPVTSVSLRNMTSKWGSCSNTGRMSLSTKLLFAPKEVQDYVMIHELCHLDELNHSDRFWSLVDSHDPNYKDSERWLKEHGHMCDVHLLGVRLAGLRP